MKQTSVCSLDLMLLCIYESPHQPKLCWLHKHKVCLFSCLSIICVPLQSLTGKHLWHSCYFLYLPTQISIQTDQRPAIRWHPHSSVAPARLAAAASEKCFWLLEHDKNNNPFFNTGCSGTTAGDSCRAPLLQSVYACLWSRYGSDCSDLDMFTRSSEHTSPYGDRKQLPII